MTERNWRTLLGDKWLPLIEELANGHMTEQQITDEYALTAEELTEFAADPDTEQEVRRLYVLRLKALITDIADGMSHPQISEIHDISADQIPRFSSTWAKQIDAARENGRMENQHLELIFEVAELMAEIAEKRAQGPSNGDELADDPGSG